MNSPLNSVSTAAATAFAGPESRRRRDSGPVPILTGNGFVPWVDAE